MAKVQKHEVEEENLWNNLRDFYEFVSKVSAPNTVRDYLESILSESELIMISRRIEIAKRLIEEQSCEEIQKAMGVGVNTVTKVNHNLKNFLLDYARKKKIRKEFKSKKGAYGTFDHLRKTYKGYFAILNALIDK